jgi:hypothetical protein
MLQQRTIMQNHSALKSSHPILHRLVFTFRTLPTHSKHFEYDQIKPKILGLKDEATKPSEREMKKKKKTINCHHSDVL